MSISAKSAKVVVSILLLAGVAAGLAWWWPVVRRESPRLELPDLLRAYQKQMLEKDPEWGIPAQRRDHVFSWSGIEASFNSLGFRGPLPSLGPSGVRIGYVGDFAALALDLTEAKRLPSLLQLALNESLGAPGKAEVLDFSIAPERPLDRLDLLRPLRIRFGVDYFFFAVSALDLSSVPLETLLDSRSPRQDAGWTFESLESFRRRVARLRSHEMIQGNFGVIPVVTHSGDLFENPEALQEKVALILAQEGFSPILLTEEQSPGWPLKEDPALRSKRNQNQAWRLVNELRQRGIP